MTFPPVFLINLDRSVDRLAESSEILRKERIEFSRISALDGSTIDTSDIVAPASPWRRALSSGEIGCFASHVLAAQRFLDTKTPIGIVLEDDFSFQRDGANTLGKLVEHIKDRQDWDIVNLGATPRRNRREIGGADCGDSKLFRAFYYPVTTTGIMWSRNGAQRFLEAVNQYKYPVDVFLKNWACKTGRGLALDPSPIVPRGEQSVIDGLNQPRKTKSTVRQGFHRIGRLISNHTHALSNRVAQYDNG